MDVQMAIQLVAALKQGLTAPTEEVQRSSDTVNIVDGLFAIAQALAAMAGELRQLNQTVLAQVQLEHNRRGGGDIGSTGGH